MAGLNLGTTSSKNVPLTLEDVNKLAPSVFSDRPWEGVSKRYTFIPTIRVVESLLSEGYNIMRAQQQTTRLPDKTNFTRHMLRFRRVSGDIAVGDVFPEIVLINSHDRGSAYQMHAGFYRLVCSNGLVVDDASFARLSIRHSGNVINDVLYGADQIAHDMPRLQENVKVMQEIELLPQERVLFAKAALSLKYDAESTPIEPGRMLKSSRMSDQKPDLWTTFNVLQEKLIRGGVPYIIPSHRDEEGNYVRASSRKTREIKSIDSDTKINKALWMLAEGMRKLKLAN